MTTPPNPDQSVREQLRVILETYTVGTGMGLVGPGNNRHFDVFAQSILALFDQHLKVATLPYKSKITRIGTFNNKGQATGWAFDAENHPCSFGLLLVPGGEHMLGGWTIRELRIIFEANQISVNEAKVEAYQDALDHDRSVDSSKYLDGGKQFRILWLQGRIDRLQAQLNTLTTTGDKEKAEDEGN